jgi:hypothetical protein
MWTEPRSLGGFITALVAALDAADDTAARRLRHVIRDRVATIALDDEAVTVAFTNETLTVAPALRRDPPYGATDSATVVALLDGRIEAHAAIVDGRIDVRASDEDVARIFAVIEILLDAAPRAPALQRLAAEFRAAHPAAGAHRTDWVSWYPFRPTTAEWQTLSAIDALP